MRDNWGVNLTKKKKAIRRDKKTFTLIGKSYFNKYANCILCICKLRMYFPDKVIPVQLAEPAFEKKRS